MKIAVGSDERTYLTDKVIEELKTRGHEVVAFGSLLENESEVDWPVSCSKVALAVANNKADEGIVFCWTGTGASIAANKVSGIRAALCHDGETARGAIAMGMDGVNTAVIPGCYTPEQYVREVTIANDGILHQKAVYQTALLGYETIQELESWGVKFQKDTQGNYDVKQVHQVVKYVLPMPEGKDLKTILTRQIKRHKVRVTNRVMATRVIVKDGRAIGAVGFDVRGGDFVVIGAKAVILCTGACGRLGLPASGYLYGTYENPTNAGDGYSMAYHAGAELTNIESFQINPLIKDYNGPACAYVAGPFGAYTANAEGYRFINCDYWSGQMMLEIWKELNFGKGPIQLKMTHLDEDTISEIESILWSNERPSRGRFHEGRGEDYRTHGIEMNISEIGLCSGHSASGVWVNEKAETTVPGLYAAGDMASVPHNYMIGAFVFSRLAGINAVDYIQHLEHVEPDAEFLEAEKARIYEPLNQPNGIPHTQVEYKLRRLVNDYLQPPKSGYKMEIGLTHILHLEIWMSIP